MRSTRETIRGHFLPACAFAHGSMQALLELAPLLAFFIAYYFGGIYVATAVLMGGMAVLLAVDYLLHRRVSPMHALSAVLVFGLGAATLLTVRRLAGSSTVTMPL